MGHWVEWNETLGGMVWNTGWNGMGHWGGMVWDTGWNGMGQPVL